MLRDLQTKAIYCHMYAGLVCRILQTHQHYISKTLMYKLLHLLLCLYIQPFCCVVQLLVINFQVALWSDQYTCNNNCLLDKIPDPIVPLHKFHRMSHTHLISVSKHGYFLFSQIRNIQSCGWIRIFHVHKQILFAFFHVVLCLDE